MAELRKEENFFIDFKVSPGIGGFLIEPLLLMPFVENSFKHISHFNNGKPNKVNIEMSKDNNYFRFCIRNTTEGNQSKELIKNGGIGLTNVKRRLELLYPATHSLAVKEKENEFEVELKLSVQ